MPLADTNKEMGLREIQDISAKITFNTADTISSVTCRLEDATGAVAGTPPVTATPGFALNQLGTSASNLVWRVWYDDFDPTALGLTRGYYLMYLLAIDSGGDKWEPVVGILVS